MNIPIVDISPFLKQQESGMRETARQIRKACLDHGFFYVSNHGISITLQARLETLSREFFSLPHDEKMRIRMELGGKAWRGYFPIGGELTSGKPDQKEGIYFGTELNNDHPMVISQTPLHGQNLFPTTPSELKQTVLEYMDEVTALGHQLIRAIALSLNLPENNPLETICSDPFILFRIFHYPATQLGTETWGVGEHTDYGLLTILKQDQIGGLQVRSNGRWIDAPPIENTFVCNIGDMLDRMTGGLFRSTPHRVRNTSVKDRLSFPLFFDPGFNTFPKPIDGIELTSSDFSDRWDGEDVYNFQGN
ncbi:MAG: isopenicillin N synthase family oxygenase, partial [Flavobacteriales bacterium]|nr:isopenicillin N synthase family oxygenase [Flavobacteriales bacterium]